MAVRRRSYYRGRYDDDIAAYVGDQTRVIDLLGQTAIPGFIEGHGHYTSFGGSLLTLDFRYCEKLCRYRSMVAEAAAETPAGEWVIGRGWHQDKWEPARHCSLRGCRCTTR